MKRREILPVALLVLILGPPTLKLVGKRSAPQVVQAVRAPVPPPPEPPATPRAWFDEVRARCTPQDVRLATDLNRPPAGVEGTGYKAACYALAGQIPEARSLLLGLSETDRPAGVASVWDVTEGLASQARHDLAGPLAELVLEFWPDRDLVLYEAGMGRWAAGDHVGARRFLERFLATHGGDDDRTESARRLVGMVDET